MPAAERFRARVKPGRGRVAGQFRVQGLPDTSGLKNRELSTVGLRPPGALEALEHIVTDITGAVAAVAGARGPHPASGPPRGGVCGSRAPQPSSEAARMIAELLRFEGFEVVFLGVPPRGDTLTSFLSRFRRDAVIVSCSVAVNLPSVIAVTLGAVDAGIASVCQGTRIRCHRPRSSCAQRTWLGRPTTVQPSKRSILLASHPQARRDARDRRRCRRVARKRPMVAC
jgi:hypothetical protein